MMARLENSGYLDFQWQILQFETPKQVLPFCPRPWIIQVTFLKSVKNSWYHYKLHIFKLADRMRSIRTNRASKNRDYCTQNGDHFPHEQM